MIAIDFFCGAGGLTRGLLNAGIEVILGIDNDEKCRETYEANNPPARFLNGDLREISLNDLESEIQKVPNKELLLTASPPCQPFTKQRRDLRNKEDAKLLKYISRLVKELQPAHVFIENVPGMTRIPGNSTYHRFRRVLSDLKYKWCGGIVDAKAYGVPQTRRRFMLIASREFEPSLHPVTHGPNLIPCITVEDAIGKFPHINAGDIHPTVPNHQASALSDLNLERIRNTPHDGGDRRSWPKHLKLECHTNGYYGHTDVYGRMRWKYPAPALTSRCNSLSNGRYGHPNQNRAISLREAASLQSFNEDYKFFGKSITHIAMQIGNAVPVKLAEAIGKHILRLANSE